MGASVPRVLALATLVLSAGLAGCVGDEEPPASDGDGPETLPEDPGSAVPVPAQISGLEHLSHLDAEQGFDAVARGETAYVSAPSGFYTVNISDPSNPEQLGVVREAASRYIELMPQADRLVAAASGAQQEVLHFLDVTDPQTPRLLTSFDPERTVHNVAVVPGTSLLYNPRGVGDPVEPGIDIIDASDPANPEVVERWTFPRTSGVQPVQTAGCGMVTFDLDKDRAFCPAVSQTYILDIADRMSPELVSTISNPAINVHHWTQTMADGEVLLIADWAAAGNTPTCDRASELPTGPPPGAVWAYDISDVEDPQPLGFVDVDPPEEVGPDEQCSPHVVEKVPGHEMAVVAWHRAGVVLLDANDPANLEVVDRWEAGGNAWSLSVHGGLVLAADRDGGLDVLRLAG